MHFQCLNDKIFQVLEILKVFPKITIKQALRVMQILSLVTQI